MCFSRALIKHASSSSLVRLSSSSCERGEATHKTRLCWATRWGSGAVHVRGGSGEAGWRRSPIPYAAPAPEVG
eukprot:scaffold27456_cov32-Tisochrysis_lutea.AAC.8